MEKLVLDKRFGVTREEAMFLKDFYDKRFGKESRYGDLYGDEYYFGALYFWGLIRDDPIGYTTFKRLDRGVEAKRVIECLDQVQANTEIDPNERKDMETYFKAAGKVLIDYGGFGNSVLTILSGASPVLRKIKECPAMYDEQTRMLALARSIQREKK